MKQLFSTVALLAASVSSLAAPANASTTCTAVSSNDVVGSINLVPSDLGGRIEIELVRADGTRELTGISESDFDPASSADAATRLLVQSPRELKQYSTGAYKNFEVLAIVRKDGKVTLDQGRTCDPYYQEEIGCLSSEDVIPETSIALSCSSN